MKTKYSKIFLAVIIFALCILLFLQRVTGEIWHTILGILLIIAASVHLCRQNAKMKYKKHSIRLIDWALIAFLAILLLTGILLHPLHEMVILKIIHKLSAAFLVIGIIIHMVQHKKAIKQS